MGTTSLSRKYMCWNDCTPGGCPSHVATLDFQSTSDHIWFKDGRGGEYGGNPVEFEMMLSMLHELSNSRVEISGLLDRAKSGGSK